MATIWPFIHNQLLFPITYAFPKEGMPSVYAHFLLYSIVMMASIAAIAFMKEHSLQRFFSSWKLIGGLGVAGSIGVSLIVACDFSTAFSSILVSIGIALSAAFIPVHFTFWSAQLLGASEKRVAFDLLASYLLFCVFTGIRIALGWHGWPFSIGLPIASSLLVRVALCFPQKAFPLRVSPMNDYPKQYVIPSLIFVYIACISIWILNPDHVLSDYPPIRRALMYAVVAGFILALMALYRPKYQLRSRATTIASALCIGFLVAAILLTGIGAQNHLDLGNFPTIAGKIVLEMTIWLVLLIHAQTRHLGIVRFSVLFLVFAVGGSNVLSVGLLFGSQGFQIDRATFPILAISVISAFAVLFSMNILMAATLSRTASHERKDEKKAPCMTAIDSALSDEAVFLRMKTTFELSARETDTLRLAVKGMSARDMAHGLFVAESTVNSHLKSIYRKTDVHSKKELSKLVERYRTDNQSL